MNGFKEAVQKVVNKEFKIVFQPKNSNYGKRRFAVGAGRLPFYVGQKNADTAVFRALNSPDDKCTVKFRKYGRIDFYRK
jgi:hypothetical protein